MQAERRPDAPPAEPRRDHRAERAILGAVLLDNANLATVEALVAPGEMHHPAHAVVLATMLELARRGVGIDYVTLGAELRVREQLEALGGHPAIFALGEEAVTSAHLEEHCRIVADHAAARRVRTAARQVLELADDLRHDARALVDKGTAAFAAAAVARDVHAPVPIGVAVRESFDRIERALAGEVRALGLTTGLAELDALLSGLRAGQVIVIAARPAMGKTTLATEIAARVAARLAPGTERVLFFSLEMPRAELADRLLARASGVDLARIRSAQLGADDLDALTRAAGEVDALPLDIDDAGDTTLLAIRTAARAWKLRHGLALLVLDYVQLVKSGPGRPETRDRQIGEVTEGLKALAKELGIPIVVVSQLNRGPETRPNKRPMLSDLRESGSIEQDADVVLFLYCDEVYNKNSDAVGTAEVICAKQRNGPTDTVRLRFVRECSRFDNLAAEDRPESTPAARPQRALPFDPSAGYTPEPREQELDDDHAF